jgi:hypothetical protein
MTAPTVTWGTVSAATTGASLNVNEPAGIAIGDLLLIIASSDTTTAPTTPTGYTLIDGGTISTGTGRLDVFARIATAANETVTYGGVAQDIVLIMGRIPAAQHGVVNVATDIFKQTAATGSGNADPPSITVGSAKDWLAIAAVCIDQLTAANTLTASPAGYTTVTLTESASSTSSVFLGVATKALSAATTENPGTFTNTSANWRALTFVIPPFVPVTQAKFEAALADDFTGTTIDTAKWAGGVVGAVTQNDVLIIPSVVGSAVGVLSATAYTLKESAVYLKVTSWPADATGEFHIYLVLDNNNYLEFAKAGDTILAQSITATTPTSASGSYATAGSPPWLRIRETAGTVYWDGSQDGITWANLWSNATPAWLTSTSPMYAQVSTFNGTAGQNVQVDNFNAAVPVSGLKVWLEADSGVTGSPVSAWASKFGAVTVTQTPDATARPAITAAQFPTGAAGVVFDGTNDFMESATAMSALITAADAEIFAVFKVASFPTDDGAAYNNATVWGDSLAFSGLHFRASSTLAIAYNWDTAITTATRTIAANTAYIADQLHTGGNLSLTINNGTPATSTSGNTGGLTGVLRLARAQNTVYGPITLGALVIYNRALTSGERAQVYAYLNTKYLGASGGPQALAGKAPTATSAKANTISVARPLGGKHGLATSAKAALTVTAGGGGTIARVDRGTTYQTQATTTDNVETSASFTPAAGSLLLVMMGGVCAGAGTAIAWTASDNFGDTGGTAWTVQKSTLDVFSYGVGCAIAWRRVGTGASAGQITVTETPGGSADRSLWASFEEVTGPAIVVQQAQNTGTGTTLGVSLGVAPAATSWVYSDSFSVFGVPTLPSGFNLVDAYAAGGGAGDGKTAYDPLSAAQTTTWSGLAANGNTAVAVEVAIAGAAQALAGKHPTATSAKGSLRLLWALVGKAPSSTSAKGTIYATRGVGGKHALATSAKATLVITRGLGAKHPVATSARGLLGGIVTLNGKSPVAVSAKSTKLDALRGLAGKHPLATSAKGSTSMAWALNGRHPVVTSAKATASATRRIDGRASTASSAKASVGLARPLDGRAATATNAKATALATTRGLAGRAPVVTNTKASLALALLLAGRHPISTSAKAGLGRLIPLDGRAAAVINARAGQVSIVIPMAGRFPVVVSAKASALSRGVVLAGKHPVATSSRGTVLLSIGLAGRAPLVVSAKTALQATRLLDGRFPTSYAAKGTQRLSAGLTGKHAVVVSAKGSARAAYALSGRHPLAVRAKAINLATQGQVDLAGRHRLAVNSKASVSLAVRLAGRAATSSSARAVLLRTFAVQAKVPLATSAKATLGRSVSLGGRASIVVDAEAAASITRGLAARAPFVVSARGLINTGDLVLAGRAALSFHARGQTLTTSVLLTGRAPITFGARGDVLEVVHETGESWWVTITITADSANMAIAADSTTFTVATDGAGMSVAADAAGTQIMADSIVIEATPVNELASAP